jgi:hypothetical protein
MERDCGIEFARWGDTEVMAVSSRAGGGHVSSERDNLLADAKNGAGPRNFDSQAVVGAKDEESQTRRPDSKVGSKRQVITVIQ